MSIPTLGNSPMVSRGAQSANCRNGPLKCLNNPRLLSWGSLVQVQPGSLYVTMFELRVVFTTA